MFLSDEGPTFKTLDFAFYIGSTPTFLYFDLYLNTAYAAHYVYFSELEYLKKGVHKLGTIKTRGCKNTIPEEQEESF